MLWAALCTGFFGFFRLGEIISPSPIRYDPHIHLTFDDIAVDSLVDTQCILVQVNQSKTDQYHVGATVSLGRSGQDLCPVAALLAYEVTKLAPCSSFKMAGI